jgi:hypothetical protein
MKIWPLLAVGAGVSYIATQLADDNNSEETLSMDSLHRPSSNTPTVR